MYERMLDKKTEPEIKEIENYIGEDSNYRLSLLEQMLKKDYQLEKDLRFPFGNHYGWGYKYSHKNKHLLYVFFEKDAFTCTIQIGDDGAKQIEDEIDTFMQASQELWTTRYPCGKKKQGGWIHYRVLSEDVLSDINRFIHAKVKTNKTNMN